MTPLHIMISQSRADESVRIYTTEDDLNGLNFLSDFNELVFSRRNDFGKSK